MINSLYLNILKYVGFALAGILIFLKIRNDGKDSVRNEQVAQIVEGVKIREKVKNVVHGSTGTERDRLRKKWSKKR
jgi:hypothetical protein